MDLAAEQRLGPFRRALVRHVGEARPGRLLYLDHGELAGATDARGGVVVLVGFLLCRRDELLQILPRRVGAHDDADRVARQPDDVGEVAQRLPVGRLVVRIAQAVDAHAGELMAVRLSIEQHRRRERAGRARPRIDEDRLAEPRPGGLAHQAEVDVGAAAGGERIVDRDRLVGLPSRLAARQRRREQRRRGQRREATAPERITSCATHRGSTGRGRRQRCRGRRSSRGR